MRLPMVGLVLALALSFAAVAAQAQQAVFIIRHAEIQLEDQAKMTTGDPPLIEAGIRRARVLARLLRDAGISAIYTSESQRTIQTAAPFAQTLGIKAVALPRDATDDLARRLREQHGRERILVVAHSHTIPLLLRALGHPKEERIGREEYDNLFIVTSQSGGTPVVIRLRY